MATIWVNELSLQTIDCYHRPLPQALLDHNRQAMYRALEGSPQKFPEVPVQLL